MNGLQDGEKNTESKKGKVRSLRFKILIVSGVILLVVVSITAVYFSFFFNNLQPTTYMIEMRDGVRLATDVYLPSNSDAPFPVVLFRTPYGKSETLDNVGFFLEHDIAVIGQDHRGCYESEGNYTCFASDGADAFDTIEWLKEQEWFNGRYATFGGSARGITQYRQVTHLEDIACQAISIATPDLYCQAMFQGGVPRKMLGESWLGHIGHEDYYDIIIENPLSSSQFAIDHRIAESDFNNVNWPSIHKGGWYDVFSQGIVDGFTGYQYSGGVGGAENAHLIMGPWTHNLNNNPEGDLLYPVNAQHDPNYGRIFNAMFAEGLLNNIEYGNHQNMPAVTYYVMGDVEATSNQWNQWAISDVWPIPYTNQSFYLQADNSLTNTPAIAQANTSYNFDPFNPVPTLGGANLIENNRGPFDQNEIEETRTDVIQFEKTISEPLLVTGRIWTKLYVTSNCTDTDFTAKLMDVYPDGKSILICDGIIRMRFRNGQQEEELLDGTESTIYECNIDLWSTSYIFNTGHKIRLSISSSNHPRFDVNPNTGEEIQKVNEETNTKIAKNTIMISSQYNSCLILPKPINLPNFIHEETISENSIHQDCIANIHVENNILKWLNTRQITFFKKK